MFELAKNWLTSNTRSITLFFLITPFRRRPGRSSSLACDAHAIAHLGHLSFSTRDKLSERLTSFAEQCDYFPRSPDRYTPSHFKCFSARQPEACRWKVLAINLRVCKCASFIQHFLYFFHRQHCSLFTIRI